MLTNDFLLNGLFITIFLFVVAVAVTVILVWFFSWRRTGYQKKYQYNLTFLQVKLPQQNEYELQAAEHFFSNLMGLKRPRFQSLTKGQYQISFEIVSKIDGIGFYVVVPDELVVFIEKLINGAYPSAEIDIIDPNEIWDRGSNTVVKEIKIAGQPYFPIKTYKDMENNDSLNSITSSLSKLSKDEVLAIQYIISPSNGSWRSAGSSFIGNVRNKSSNPEKNYNIDTSVIEGVEKKIGKPGFDVAIRVVAISDDKISAENHARNIITSFEQFSDVRYNKFKAIRKSQRKLVDNFIYRRIKSIHLYIPVFGISLYNNTSVLNTEEMATVFHFPNKEVQTPNIVWLTARRGAVPPNVPKEGLYLGRNIFRSVVTPIFMKEDDRARHNYIVGQTGTGKSVFMSSLAIQDINEGRGVAYIDPHGSEIDKILEQIPPERVEDVILFDASNTSHPMGLNILEAENEEQKHMVINSFIAQLYKLYDPNRQGIMGPQLERAIRNVMLTAMIDKESTLVDVLRLLIDDNYVQSFIPRIQDPLVKRYWTDEMAQTTAHTKSEKLGYFVSKFDRFVTDKLMRNILGQPKSAFNMSKVMAEKKILLVDLSKGKIGEENSSFLGLVLVPKILGAALARASLIGKEEFPHFYLYVDEFQNFATPDFATILSEARKYKLNLTVAHQFVAQLSDDIKEAVFGNVGTMEVFRVGSDDAEYLESQFEPVFTKSDLINNQVGNCYIRLLIDGHPSVPFSLNVDWEKINSYPRNKEIAKQIREMSSEKYAKPVSEVEELVNKRMGLDDRETTQQTTQYSGINKKLMPF
jgi:hypothetical protein